MRALWFYCLPWLGFNALMTLPPGQKHIFTVTQLNRSAKDLLETYLPILWVEGEISNFSRPSSGHWYFTLKDDRAQVRCAMFRNRNLQARVQPKNGDKVLVRGNVSLYEGRGDYQLIAEHMEPAGRGDLQQQFEALKLKLQTLGWFLPEHKKPLPKWPTCIGVITSPTGAAIHDVLQVLQRRAPNIAVKVFPVAVQGAEAAPQIIKAIALANRLKVCDVLILGRGGGSLEDLWAFNEEAVAKAVFESSIPIISAVGHEVDFSICDFVADLRAPTPSAAAELASPNASELARRFQNLQKQFVTSMRLYLKHAQQQLVSARARLQHPRTKLNTYSQRLDRLELRLVRASRQKLVQQAKALASLNERHRRQSPMRLVHAKQLQLQQAKDRLAKAMSQLLSYQNTQLQQAAALLNSVSPLATLVRGYAILITPNGEIVRKANDVQIGEELRATLGSGALMVNVSKVQP